MKYLFKFIFPFLCSSVEAKRLVRHAMPSEFGGKWGTECLNTKFSILLCVGYSVMLILFVSRCDNKAEKTNKYKLPPSEI